MTLVSYELCLTELGGRELVSLAVGEVCVDRCVFVLLLQVKREGMSSNEVFNTASDGSL